MQKQYKADFITTLAEINIAYKDSPIVEDYGGSSGPAVQ